MLNNDEKAFKEENKISQVVIFLSHAIFVFFWHYLLVKPATAADVAVSDNYFKYRGP